MTRGHVYPNTPPGEIVEKIDAIQALLKTYQGEPIEKGEHPIHRAVVELETRLILRPTYRQPHAMPYTIGRRWYRLLTLSRQGHTELAKLYAGFFHNLLEDLREEVLDGNWHYQTQQHRRVPSFSDPFPWQSPEAEE